MQITTTVREVFRKATMWFPTVSVGYGYHGQLRQSGGGSSAGVRVDGPAALQSSTVAACCNLIGTTVANLGFDIYREKKSGSVDLVSDHPLHQILHWEPNRNQTSDEFWQRAMFELELYGNSVSKIIRNSSGIIGLETQDPCKLEVERKNGDLSYRFYPDAGGAPEVLTERGRGDEFQVLHLRNVTLDGITGISTVSLARERIGLDLAVEKYGARFFGKGGRIKDIFAYDGVLKKEQRDQWKQIFAEEYGNIEKSHEAMLLEKGFTKAGTSGATPNEAQFLETQISIAIAICRFFGIPPTMVGILDRATYNNQEQLMLQFLQLGMTPRVSRAEKSLRRGLLTNREKDQGFKIQCKLQKLLRADTRTRAEFYKTLAMLGAINANEIRMFEDMPRIEDPSADEYMRAVNIFGPEDTAAAAGASAGAEAGTQAAQDAIRTAA